MFLWSPLRYTEIQKQSGYTAIYKKLEHWAEKKASTRTTSSLPRMPPFCDKAVPGGKKEVFPSYKLCKSLMFSHHKYCGKSCRLWQAIYKGIKYMCTDKKIQLNNKLNGQDILSFK